MRDLTIHEKINLRASLARKGIDRATLIRLNMTEVKRLWIFCYGYLPLTEHSTIARLP